jgi:acetyltransferase
MTIRNLDALLRPGSVAVIGATEREHSVGRKLTENLLAGGFPGALLAVNPKRQEVLGLRAYPDVASLPVVPDLAVIATPPATVPDLIGELAAAGTRAAVVISAGFNHVAGNDNGNGSGNSNGNSNAKGDGNSVTLREAMLAAARPALLRIIGPNCLGLMVPGLGLNASFSHLTPLPGRIAFVAQSGAITTSILDWAHARGIGFSHMISLGDMADVDFGDLIDWLANDSSTHAILLYIEAITQARKFMSAARAAARGKPVLVVKSGRHEASAAAAATHTGVLAGSDAAYDAAFRRAGMLRVFRLEELFDAVETLALARRPRGPKLAIVTNGGGIGVLAADALLDGGGELATLADATLRQLDAQLPATWSRGNPVDIIGDATAARYRAVLPMVLADPGVDGVLVLHCPTAVASGVEAAQAVIDAIPDAGRCTVLTSWVGEHAARAARDLFQQHGVPTFPTPEQAVRAFMQMVDYRRNQMQLMETPPSLPELFSPNADVAHEVITTAMEAGRNALTMAESKRLLKAYGIPVTEATVVTTPDEAAAAADAIAVPVALKVLSPNLSHKSDLGGVQLGLSGGEAVREAAEAMQQRIRARAPEADLQGFTVEPMADRRGALELIAGAAGGGEFGPVILFGQGGTAVEVVADTAVALPPLNLHLARELMSRTRVWRLMGGYRDVAPVDADAVALALTRLSQLLVDFPCIAEIDVNPLLATADGVVALDARVRLDLQIDAAAGRDRLAICPYPKELEQDVPLPDGRALFLRPVLPEDEPAVHRGFARLSDEEIRARFFNPVKMLSHLAAARFTQIDYDREMALVLTEHKVPGEAELFGVVHIASDPDRQRAEFAIIIEKRFTGLGLGQYLMRTIIEYARSRGIAEIWGDVLADNRTMRRLCASLGFVERRHQDDPGLIRVVLSTGSAASGPGSPRIGSLPR